MNGESVSAGLVFTAFFFGSGIASSQISKA